MTAFISACVCKIVFETKVKIIRQSGKAINEAFQLESLYLLASSGKNERKTY